LPRITNFLSPDTASSQHVKAVRLLMVDGLGQLTREFKNDLGAQADIEVVRIADTAAGAIDHQEDVRPDVVLMDFLVTGGTGVAAARLVHERYPKAAVVLLCGVRPDNRLLADLPGVTAFLPITSSATAVVDIVRQAAEDAGHAPRPLHRGGVGRGLVLGIAPDRGALGRFLSSREQRLLELMSLGLTSKGIARELGLSASTARTYTQRLLEKLDTHSKIEAVRKAIRLGLIEP
jgi:DNA-binding NarL/FixJ family response regulator